MNMLNTKTTRPATPKPLPADENHLGFGKIFTDHMFLMDYNIDKGWYDPRIVPYAPFTLAPPCWIRRRASDLLAHSLVLK